MPVMVVGVDNVIGARAGRALVSRGGEVRVFIQADGQSPAVPDDAWRALRCKVARGDLVDEAHVESAMEQVHTVLALLGRPAEDPDRYLEQVATVISGAIGAGCRRLVLLSDLAVTQPQDNPWLAALADAEDMAMEAPLESVVIRAATIYAAIDPQAMALAGGALGPEPRGIHWPIHADDVAIAAVLADAERELDTSLHVVVNLAGPEQLTTAVYADRLATALPVAARVELPPHAVDLLLRDVPRPADALGVGAMTLQDLAALD